MPEQTPHQQRDAQKRAIDRALREAREALTNESEEERDDEAEREALVNLYEAIAGERPARRVRMTVSERLDRVGTWGINVPVDVTDEQMLDFLTHALINGEADQEQDLVEDVRERDVTKWDVID